MEVQKDVGNPTASQGGQTVDIEELTPEEKQVIELLRTPKLSIKHMDEPTKETVRNVMQHLHLERRISIMDIAKLIGNKTSGYVSWVFKQLGIQPRDFEEARLAGIRQKVRKYERKPFDGTDEAKAYLLGLRHGDLSASRPFGDATRVSMSTTHAAQADLFTSLFSPYGHVYKHPRYKKDTKTHEWNFQTVLDESFGFLLDARDKCRQWVSSNDGTALSYLAGLIDAEGNIGISRNARTTAIIVSIYNTDTDLLNFAKNLLKQLGLHPLGPYLDKPKDTITSKYQIPRRKDYWRIALAWFEECQALLSRLPLKHKERIQLKAFATSIVKGEQWENVKGRMKALRQAHLLERQEFVDAAERTYKQTHVKEA